MKKLRVFLVDDSRVFIYAAKAMLASLPNVEVVGTADSAESALQQIPGLSPELVFMDLSLPGMNGIRAMREINALPIAPKLVLLSLHARSDYRDAVFASGGMAMICKSDFAHEVPDLIDSLLEEADFEYLLAA